MSLGDFFDDVGGFFGDTWDDFTEWVAEDIFGAPSEEEIAAQQAEQAAIMEQIAEANKPLNANNDTPLDIRNARKAKLASLRSREQADSIASENNKNIGAVAGLRGGTGFIQSMRGKDRERFGTQKFKSMAPLRLGMPRP